MMRGLERRLKAAEARRFGSARVAEVLRALDSMSDLELAEQLSPEPSGVFDPHTMTDRELDCCVAELERRRESAGTLAEIEPVPVSTPVEF